MNRLSELKENRKLDNKGFSLVELIIVIAIMAVLVGVLAPQYLKYVEKSRVATDKDNVVAMVGALQVYGADPDATTAFSGGEKITITSSGTTITEASGNTAATDAFNAAGMTTVTSTKLSNKQSFDTVEINITISSGNVSVVAKYLKGGSDVTSSI